MQEWEEYEYNTELQRLDNSKIHIENHQQKNSEEEIKNSEGINSIRW